MSFSSTVGSPLFCLLLFPVSSEFMLLLASVFCGTFNFLRASSSFFLCGRQCCCYWCSTCWAASIPPNVQEVRVSAFQITNYKPQKDWEFWERMALDPWAWHLVSNIQKDIYIYIYISKCNSFLSEAISSGSTSRLCRLWDLRTQCFILQCDA